MLPAEVQSYIRHILHIIGMLLVARAGYSQEAAEMFAAMGVNLIALGWYIYVSIRNHRRDKNRRKPHHVDDDS